EKGQRILIEALSRLGGVDFETTIVGGGYTRKHEVDLKEFVQRSGMGGKVRFSGWLEGEELTRAYSKSDIFVLPTLSEAYGIVVHEAMSFGLPVIASRVGGIPEQITDGVEGFLVPPGDVKALSEALRRLITDRALREAMGKRATERATELPTWEDVCGKFYRALKATDKR
ncbi:glycosyltransferase family 4 protein, partial [Candidatus Omnitrophota bacterium]